MMTLPSLSTLQLDNSHHPSLLIVKLNSPKKLNALTLEMIAEMFQVIEFADKSNIIKCVIWTGNGSAFSAGADFTQWNLNDKHRLMLTNYVKSKSTNNTTTTTTTNYTDTHIAIKVFIYIYICFFVFFLVLGSGLSYV